MWWISAIIWGFAAVIVIIRLVLVGRTYRSWGYVEREDDLYITHGVLFRSLVAVPYGRMQLVEVESGPLERAFGIATVSLKTASVETNATIPGLPPEEAARLRDRLTELGEARRLGAMTSPAPAAAAAGTDTAPVVPGAPVVKQTERPHPATPFIRGWLLFVAILLGWGRQLDPRR